MKVVTICGSMRFEKEMQKIAWELETTKGYSVIQCVYNVENNAISKEQTDKLNAAHFKKIDISDSIYVVNIGGYIGSQVEKEIEYALSEGKEVIYHETERLNKVVADMSPDNYQYERTKDWVNFSKIWIEQNRGRITEEIG